MQGKLAALDLRDGSPLLPVLCRPDLLPLRTTYDCEFGKPLGDLYFFPPHTFDPMALLTDAPEARALRRKSHVGDGRAGDRASRAHAAPVSVHRDTGEEQNGRKNGMTEQRPLEDTRTRQPPAVLFSFPTRPSSEEPTLLVFPRHM